MDNVTPMRAPRRPPPRRRPAIVVTIVVLVILIASLAGRFLGLYVDWLWFGEVGLRSVFWTGIWSRLVLGIAAAASSSSSCT